MRENPRERNHHQNTNPWITVTNRKHINPPTSSSRTCFIDSLPIDISINDLERIFYRYGTISNIFIPPKMRPRRKLRYAFIQFSHPKSLQLAIQHENGVRIGNNRISVMPAKLDYPSPSKTYPHPNLKPQPNQHAPAKHTPCNHQKSQMRDHRSYKEVSLNQNQNP